MPPPPPSPSASASNLTFEGDLKDATSANVELPEPSDVLSKLQHALAALCLHSPSDTIEPRMLRVDLDKVVPNTYTIHAKDTLFATLMHKKFAQHPQNTNPVLTTREVVGKTTPSEHETS